MTSKRTILISMTAAVAICASSSAAIAADKECVSDGKVYIDSVLAGSKDGTMARLSDRTCGYMGWIFLDIEGKFGTIETGRAVLSVALALHLSGKPVKVYYSLDYSTKGPTHGSLT